MQDRRTKARSFPRYLISEAKVRSFASSYFAGDCVLCSVRVLRAVVRMTRVMRVLFVSVTNTTQRILSVKYGSRKDAIPSLCSFLSLSPSFVRFAFVQQVRPVQ